jgi:hypothetical protein
MTGPNLWASLFVRILEVLGQHLSDKPAVDSALARGKVLAELGRLHAELDAIEAQAMAQRATVDKASAEAGYRAALREVLRRVLARELPSELSAVLQEADATANSLRADGGAAPGLTPWGSSPHFSN